MDLIHQNRGNKQKLLFRTDLSVGICPPYDAEEEQEFMRTMEQVDAWLEAEIAEAQERKQQEIALNFR
jgi:hypothetical protein